MEAVEEFDEIEKLQHQGINAGDIKVLPSPLKSCVAIAMGVNLRTYRWFHAHIAGFMHISLVSRTCEHDGVARECDHFL